MESRPNEKVQVMRREDQIKYVHHDRQEDDRASRRSFAKTTIDDRKMSSRTLPSHHFSGHDMYQQRERGASVYAGQPPQR
jgi:hypothetical protein